MSSVVKLNEYKAKESVASLEELLKRAKRGEVTGFAYVLDGLNGYEIGMTAEMRRRPVECAGLITRLQMYVQRLMDYGS